MSALLSEILEKTLEELKGTKKISDPVLEELSVLFTKGRITKKRVISVLESDLGEIDETS